jgi:hypothetical protein
MMSGTKKPTVLFTSSIAALMCGLAMGAASAVAAETFAPPDDVMMAYPADPAEQPAVPASGHFTAPRPLPMSAAHAAAKDAANRAFDEAEKRGEFGPAAPAPAEVQPRTPATMLNIAGQIAVQGSPSDATGAIGPHSYIQLINPRARIVNRTTGATIATATLNEFAHAAATVKSFDPQLIWDATTNRFYYVMDSIYAPTDNRLSFGFSKTSNPGHQSDDRLVPLQPAVRLPLSGLSEAR